MPECNVCKAEIKWPQPYKSGDKPLNPDGSIHYHSPREEPTPTTNAAQPPTKPGQPIRASQLETPKIKILKVKKIIIDLANNDLILTVEEYGE